MSRRLNRRIRKLGDLRVALADADHRWRRLALELDAEAGPELRRTVDHFGRVTRTQLVRAEAYGEELERTGTIADPEFERWFDSVKPLAELSLARAMQDFPPDRRA